MGNVCGARVVNSAPNAATGLTNHEMKLIRDLWYSIMDKVTFKETGTLFFLKLFQKYPYMQEYFRDFAKKNQQELKGSLSLRAHGISVFVAITAYVDCMDDPETLVALIHKRVPSHYMRGVNFQDMENLKTCVLEFLQEAAPGSRKNLGKALEAWDKLLTVHNSVYQSKVEEIIADNTVVSSSGRTSGSDSTSYSNAGNYRK